MNVSNYLLSLYFFTVWFQNGTGNIYLAPDEEHSWKI